MKRLLAGLSLVSVLVLSGCGSKVEPAPATGSPLDPFVGKWGGSGGGDNYALTVTKDGHFTISADAGKGKHLAEGDATVKEHLLVLVATKIDGKPPTNPDDKMPAQMAVSSDGQTLTPLGDGHPLTRMQN